MARVQNSQLPFNDNVTDGTTVTAAAWNQAIQVLQAAVNDSQGQIDNIRGSQQSLTILISSSYPANPGTGTLVFRNDLSQLKMWDGSQWRDPSVSINQAAAMLFNNTTYLADTAANGDTTVLRDASGNITAVSFQGNLNGSATSINGTANTIPVRDSLGSVVLGANPTSAMQAATKQYVDQATGSSGNFLALERDVANLKAVSTIANRVDQASGLFYDLLDGVNGGSIGKLDTARTNVVGTLTLGATTCTVKDASAFAVNTEVTFQDIVTETVRERVVITGIAGNVLTFAALQNSYADKAVVYRSLVIVNKSSKLMSMNKANYPALESMSQLSAPSSLPEGAATSQNIIQISADGKYLVMMLNVTPWIAYYKIGVDGSLTRLANPDVLPAGQPQSVAFSPDGQHLAVGHTTTPFITVYKRNGDTLTKLANANIPTPTASAVSLSYSPDSVHLAAGINDATYYSIFKKSGDTYTLLTKPTGGAAWGHLSSAWSSDGVYLAFGLAGGNYMELWKRSGDTFTFLTAPASLPTSSGMSVSFSPDTIYLAVAINTAVATTCLNIYKRSGDTFTKLAAPFDVNPPTTPRALCFSSDGNYLLYASGQNAAGVSVATVYKHSGDSFTKQSDPPGLTAQTGYGAAITPDLSLSVVATSTSPYLYSWSGGVGIDVLEADVRYNITPASAVKSLVAWVDHETDPGYTVSGSMSIVDPSAAPSFTSMTKSTSALDGTHNEDQFTGSVGTANTKTTLKLVLDRTATTITKNITQVTGAVGQ